MASDTITLTEPQALALDHLGGADKGRARISGQRHSRIKPAVAQALADKGLITIGPHPTIEMSAEWAFLTDAGRTECAARDGARQQAHERETAIEAERYAAKRAEVHARAAAIDPALSPNASRDEPQRVQGPEVEARFTDRVTGVSPRVAAHIELAARLDECDGRVEGAADQSERERWQARGDELTSTLATLLRFGVVEAPVPTTEYELALLRLADDGRTQSVALGEAADRDGRWTEADSLDVMVIATVDALRGLWRRDLVAYVGGGEFVLTERGQAAVAQARGARR